VTTLREAGVLVTIAGGQALRFCPPLIITEQQIDEGIALVDQVLGTLS
jgi:4-aminobutyrate aminotransferase-like enzyme